MKTNRLWDELISGLEDDPLYRAEEIATDIAMKVDERLDEHGLSRKELASRLQVSRSYVTQLLNGHSNMTLRSLCKLAYAVELRVDVDLRPKYRSEPVGSADSILVHYATGALDFDASAACLDAFASLAPGGGGPENPQWVIQSPSTARQVESAAAAEIEKFKVVCEESVA